MTPVRRPSLSPCYRTKSTRVCHPRVSSILSAPPPVPLIQADGEAIAGDAEGVDVRIDPVEPWPTRRRKRSEARCFSPGDRCGLEPASRRPTPHQSGPTMAECRMSSTMHWRPSWWRGDWRRRSGFKRGLYRPRDRDILLHLTGDFRSWSGGKEGECLRREWPPRPHLRGRSGPKMTTNPQTQFISLPERFRILANRAARRMRGLA